MAPESSPGHLDAAMADPLTEKIREALARAAVMAQERLSLRGHALYCAAMTFAERGERVSSVDVLIRADLFLEWIEKAEPRADVVGGSGATPPKGSSGVDHAT